MQRFPETMKAALTDIVSAMADNPTPFVRTGKVNMLFPDGKKLNINGEEKI